METLIREARGRRPELLAIFVLCLSALAVLPPFFPTYLQNLMTKILIYTIFGMSLDLLVGYAALPSLGHASYFGTGAYTAAILLVNQNFQNFWAVALLSLIAAGIVAALFAPIALRVSGIYFLLITFALSQLLFWVAWLWRSVTGGDDGMGGMIVLNIGFPLSWTPLLFYYFVFAIALLCYFGMHRLVSSPFGRILRGIAGNESRMRALGYNTWAFKYLIFVISAVFAGIPGVLYVYFNQYVSPSTLGIHLSGLAMFIVILGGAMTLHGAFLGSVVILSVEYLSSLYFPKRWPLILGTTFVLTAMFIRGGIYPHIVKLCRRERGKHGSATVE